MNCYNRNGVSIAQRYKGDDRSRQGRAFIVMCMNMRMDMHIDMRIDMCAFVQGRDGEQQGALERQPKDTFRLLS